MTRTTTAPHQSISSSPASTSSMRLRATVRFSLQRKTASHYSPHRARVTNMLLRLLACEGPLRAIAVWDRLFGKGAWDRDLGHVFSTSEGGESNGNYATDSEPAPSSSPNNAAAAAEAVLTSPPRVENKKHRLRGSKRRAASSAGSGSSGEKSQEVLGKQEPPKVEYEQTDGTKSSFIAESKEAEAAREDIISDASSSSPTLTAEPVTQKATIREPRAFAQQNGAYSGGTAGGTDETLGGPVPEVAEEASTPSPVSTSPATTSSSFAAKRKRPDTARKLGDESETDPVATSFLLQSEQHHAGAAASNLMSQLKGAAVGFGSAVATKAKELAVGAANSGKKTVAQKLLKEQNAIRRELEMRTEIIEHHVAPLDSAQSLSTAASTIRIRRCVIGFAGYQTIDHYFVTFQPPGRDEETIVVEYHAGGIGVYEFENITWTTSENGYANVMNTLKQKLTLEGTKLASRFDLLDMTETKLMIRSKVCVGGLLGQLGTAWKEKVVAEAKMQKLEKEITNAADKAAAEGKEPGGAFASLHLRAQLKYQEMEKTYAEWKLEQLRLGTPEFLKEKKLPGPPSANPNPIDERHGRFRDPEPEPIAGFTIKVTGLDTLSRR
ncbi:unnamed protein product [Amoebophrya sp. A120]|nr:unnamed protein product [Amoebophrya sp. A120]|eukprot:GSA120T00019341001.1